METAIRIARIHRLDSTSLRVLEKLSEELGDQAGRVSYTKIAQELDLSRNAVKYAVERMIQRGTIEYKNGDLSLKGVIVHVEKASK